jgi:peptidoglycan/LPS O-acetylase OafA/YrhL
MGPRHRRDIDGLRAIAIIPVVLFHAHVPYMFGGFVGVDVFLVISGYLITTLLLDDIQADRFSIAYFYERRVRRILPALFGVLAVSGILAHLLLLPDDHRDFGRSLLATVFFSSNIFFYFQGGYFDRPAETKPLLHTWSLSVEEQFYIFFPLFLLVVARYFRRRFALALGAVLLVSLASSIWGTQTHAWAAFYLAPSRAWELLVGALLATKTIPNVRKPLAANILALTGLGLIGYSVFAFSGATPFPGANALYPVVGTALVLYSGMGANTLVARFLSLGPMVFIGLISYSLYLWHWVLLTFARYYAVRPLTALEVGVTIGASVIIAAASWRFVEAPFRGRHGIGSRRWVFSRAVAISLGLSAYGVAAFLTSGMPGRFSDNTLKLLSSKDDLWTRRDQCNGTLCRIGSTGTPETFILWGDSHASAIAPVVEHVALGNRRSGFVAFQTTCAPLIGMKRYDMAPGECGGLTDSVLARVDSDRIQTILLHARWAVYAEGSGYFAESRPPLLLTPSRRMEDNYIALDTLLRGTLAELRRRQLNVVLIASVPEIGIHVPIALARMERTGFSVELAPRYSDFVRRQARTLQILRRAAEDYGVRLAYPHEEFCDTAVCSVARNGRPVYWDDDHLSSYGAMFLAPMFEQLLKAPPQGAKP